MLTFTAKQMAIFTHDAEERFVDRLTGTVAAKSVKPIDHLPRPVLRRIVGTVVKRARAFGLTFQSTLTEFAMLSFDIAPDFDGQPRIFAALTRPWGNPDPRFTLEMDSVPKVAWSDAMTNASAVGWYLEDPLPRTDRLPRLASALVTLFRQSNRPVPGDPAELASRGIQLAFAHGYRGEDADWVVAVAAAISGPGHVNAKLAGKPGPPGIEALRVALLSEAVWA